MAKILQHSSNRVALKPLGHDQLDHDPLTFLVENPLTDRIDPKTCAGSRDVHVHGLITNFR